GLAAAGDIDDDVDTVGQLGGLQRGADVGLLDLEREVDVRVLAVDLELAGAFADPDPRDRRLPPAGAPGVSGLRFGRWHVHSLSSRKPDRSWDSVDSTAGPAASGSDGWDSVAATSSWATRASSCVTAASWCS